MLHLNINLRSVCLYTSHNHHLSKQISQLVLVSTPLQINSHCSLILKNDTLHTSLNITKSIQFLPEIFIYEDTTNLTNITLHIIGIFVNTKPHEISKLVIVELTIRLTLGCFLRF